jgi:hypothetical protein
MKALITAQKRRVINTITKQLEAVSENLLFEKMTKTTLNNAYKNFEKVLESFKEKKGLYSYNVNMEYDMPTHSLNGQVYLRMDETTDFIVLDFSIIPIDELEERLETPVLVQKPKKKKK